MARRPDDVVEIVSTLGETILAIELVSTAAYRLRAGGAVELGSAASETRVGLVTIRVRRIAAPPARSLPRAAPDRRARVYFAASLAVHLGVLAIGALARSPPAEGRGAARGTPRPRLVANHASARRAPAGARETPRPLAAASAATAPTAPTPPTSRAPTGPHPQLHASTRAAASSAHVRARASAAAVASASAEPEATREPCAQRGDCGVIATGHFATVTDGHAAGDDFELPGRDPSELAQSAVSCTADGECATVTGADQGDIRAQIQQHLPTISACLAHSPSDEAAVDFAIAADGTVHDAHGADATATCIAASLSTIKFPPTTPRRVTLAFHK